MKLRLRARWVGIGAVLFVVILAVSIRRADDGPVYGGRTLSEWVNSYGDNLDPDEPLPESDARQAIVILLSNNLAWAVQSIQYDPNPRRMREVAQYQKMPRFLRRNGWGVRMFGEDRELTRSSVALLAFDIAGPRAEFALPELSRVMFSTNKVAALNAIHALSRIGPAGQGPLESIFTNSAYPFRAAAAHVLVPHGVTGCEHLLPLLYASPDLQERTAATNTMRRWGLEAGQMGQAWR